MAHVRQHITPGEDEAVRQALEKFSVGSKLRQLRQEQKMLLADLGRATGLSISMLSQLETGRLLPTLPTLIRLALALGVEINYFFTDERTKLVPIENEEQSCYSGVSLFGCAGAIQ